ncbi:MAG: 50S ribosomal protein L18e [Candidatus Pacearchaeota archaeon]|nr:50S ribosomal protein L18e [Candidatus Pacearchaeota archaeon]
MISKTQINKKAQRKNEELKKVIFLLKKESKKEPKFLTVAKYLAFPTKKRIEVGLSKIDKYSKEGETIIVPGKVLQGRLTKKINIVAFRVSKKALETIKNSGSNFMNMEEFVKKGKKDFKVII